MLPGEDGLTLCRRLREAGLAVPLIMLTAKGDEVDRIVGLEIGADDYLPKPFNPRELVARINAVIRRHAVPAPAAQPAAITFGPYSLDLTARTLRRDGEPVPLTSGEFKLLAIFARHPHQPLDRERLLGLLKDEQGAVFDRAIDSQVSRLRRKIEPPPECGAYLRTMRGFGYVFDPGGAPE
jgi:two-component system phosphate regulon response regulator OmpR